MIAGLRWWEWVLMFIIACLFGLMLGLLVPLGSA